MAEYTVHTPKVSVLIPTYGGAEFLGEAILSVLGQSYPNFELIIVDDASPDNTPDVVKHFNDPRFRYIRHDINQGADIARYTGLQASSGEVVALLDQDDYFHPDKLQRHVAFLTKHPEVGFTYNARFELNYSSSSIRDLWRPPREISLSDLVVWFPLSPSDVVIRREWALQMDLINGSRGAEITHFGRLFMSGCKFGYVDRALNYRRYHSGRRIKDLVGGCESEINKQVQIFDDPKCPPDVLSYRNIAHANIYMYWAYLAYAQEATSVGQEFVNRACRLKPSILNGIPCELVLNLFINSTDDEKENHELVLRRIFDQLPQEYDFISAQYEWALAQGYLLKGTRAIIWDRPEAGKLFFEQAGRLDVKVDEWYLYWVTQQVLNYEIEFGAEAANNIMVTLISYIDKLGTRSSLQKLNSNYLVNGAFYNYRSGEYSSVPKKLLRAIYNDPKILKNRGILSILFRSTYHSLTGPA